MPAFTYRSARSPSFTAGISVALVVETVAIHALLVSRHPWLTWVMTASTLSVIAWLIDHYMSMGRGAVQVSPDAVSIKVGRRFSLTVSRKNVASAVRPTFRDLPQMGSVGGADYLNLTKPAPPNVLLTLETPMTVSAGPFRRTARRLGLHLDRPDEFLQSLD
jgi:hypothetical protein